MDDTQRAWHSSVGQRSLGTTGWIVAFLSISLVTFLVLGPALQGAWWYRDDFWCGEQSASRLFAEWSTNGRALQGFWMLTYLLDRGAHAESWNQALRFVQVLCHAGTASVVAALLARVATAPIAIASVLPFVLWGFAGESALWRSAGIYPLSALLSATGLLLLQQRTRGPGLRPFLSLGGVILVTLAALTAQAPAVVSAVVVAIQATVVLATGRWDRLRPFTIDAICVVGALMIGAAISLWIGQSGTRVRIGGALAEKIEYLWQLITLVVLFPGRYPQVLKLANCLLLACCVGLLAVRGGLLGRRFASVRPSAAFAAVSGLATLFVLPHAAALVASENWASLRVLYLGPLLFTGAWLAMVQVLPTGRAFQVFSLLLLGAIVIPNAIILRQFAVDRAALYEADRKLVRDLESAAELKGTRRVLILTYPKVHVVTWNPHKVATSHLDSSCSNLQVDWSAHSFIRRFSNLEPIADAALELRAATICNDRQTRPDFEIIYDSESRAICLCPPR